MRGKPFLFISIVCLMVLAACTPPEVVPSTGSGSSSGSAGSGSGSAGSGSEPMTTPVPGETPNASTGEVTSVPEVSTTMPGGPIVSGGTGESGTAMPLPTQDGSGGVVTGGGIGPKGIITPGPDGNLSVTLDDQGKTVRLKVGERFLLNLGEGYDWSPIVADQTVVSRVPNIMVIRGAQGIYEAHKAGTTTMNVTGDPTCRQSKPPCGMPSRMFSITIVVE